MEDFDSYIKEKGDIWRLAAMRLTRLKEFRDDPELEGAEKRPLSVSWLRWRRVELTGGEMTGEEIVNAELSKALREGHTDFSQGEWEGFISETEEREKIESGLTLHSYINVGSLYYKPAAMDMPVLPWDTYTVRVHSCVCVCVCVSEDYLKSLMIFNFVYSLHKISHNFMRGLTLCSLLVKTLICVCGEIGEIFRILSKNLHKNIINFFILPL